MTTTESNERNAQHDRTASTLVENLFEIGARWATFGIGVSRQALVHGARTLEQTARTLETLADELGRRATATATQKETNEKESTEKETNEPKSPDAVTEQR
jgi:hypothetical protein